MSDYEVTLVNDNSTYTGTLLPNTFTDDLMQCSSAPINVLSPTLRQQLTYFRQEFYVRFKGPEESVYP